MTTQAPTLKETETASGLVDAVNEGLAFEYAALITYRTYASQVQGPHRRELREFFSSEIPDELTHAQILADKVVALGGVPVTRPAPVKAALDPKEMLANALADEKATIERYVKLRELATTDGEHGLAVDLDDLIADETRHRDEIQLILNRWD
jgi:bacterioferritin